MPCERIGRSAIFCTASIYEYKGYIFEHGGYIGPVQLRKDLEPRERISKGFYDLWGEFCELPAEEQEKYRCY